MICELELFGFGLPYPGNGEGHVEVLASLQAEAPWRRSGKCHSVSAHGSKNLLYYLVSSKQLEKNGGEDQKGAM